jgi:hypothetical protein
MNCRHQWTQSQADKPEHGYTCLDCGDQMPACKTLHGGQLCGRPTGHDTSHACRTCTGQARDDLRDITGLWHDARHRLDTLTISSARLDTTRSANGSMPGGDLLVWTQTTGSVDETLGMPAIGTGPVPLFAWLTAWARTISVNSSLTFQRGSVKDQSVSALAIWIRLHLAAAFTHPHIAAELPRQLHTVSTRLAAYLGLDDQPIRADYPCPECHQGRPQRWDGKLSWTCPHCRETWPDDRALKAAVDTVALGLAQTLDLPPDSYIPWDGPEAITVHKRWPRLDRKTLNQWAHRRHISTRSTMQRTYYLAADIDARLADTPTRGEELT